MPREAVIAFDLKECPPGWSDYEQLRGRFVIGAATEEEINGMPASFAVDARGKNLVKRELGSAGGELKHQLTAAEMPSHDHSQAAATPYNVILTANGKDTMMSAGDEKGSEPNLRSVGRLQTQGSNEPHDIILPYVALRFCAKGGAL